MLDHSGVSLSDFEHTASFIFCHGTQTMHVALATGFVNQAATHAGAKLHTQFKNWISAMIVHCSK